MLRYCILILLGAFLFSCAAKKPELPKDVAWLDDISEGDNLTSEQQQLNQRLIEEFSKKKALIAKLKKEDTQEKEVLETKKAELQEKQEAFEKLIEEKIANQEVRDLVAKAATAEELEKILREQTNLTEAEIQELVRQKKTLVQKDKNLRLEALEKIYARLIRNRDLGVESLFCSTTSALDQFVLTPITYGKNQYSIEKAPSTKLFQEVGLILDFLESYEDLLLQIEGNADERGTNVYNKSLGDFRWTGAEKLTLTTGFYNEIRGISKGEECPVEQGDNSIESWWKKNRRSDFVWKLKE